MGGSVEINWDKAGLKGLEKEIVESVRKETQAFLIGSPGSTAASRSTASRWPCSGSGSARWTAASPILS